MSPQTSSPHVEMGSVRTSVKRVDWLLNLFTLWKHIKCIRTTQRNVDWGWFAHVSILSRFKQETRYKWLGYTVQPFLSHHRLLNDCDIVHCISSIWFSGNLFSSNWISRCPCDENQVWSQCRGLISRDRQFFFSREASETYSTFQQSWRDGYRL